MSGKLFHGGGLDAAISRYGGDREDWLDLSTGINPVGYPVPDLSPGIWNRLPDEMAMRNLLDAAADYYGLRHGSIVAGNGTQAILEVLPSVIEADKVAIVSPSYAEHAHVWRKAGVIVDQVPEPEEAEGDVAVIVNPNNPDGRRWQPDVLQRLAARLEKKGGTLIVDEAFADAMPDLSIVSDLPENAIVLRSFGKFFGLAGLRLGFAIAHDGIAERIKSRLGPWPVSGPALEIGRQAFLDKTWISGTRERLADHSGRLAEMLANAGLFVCGETPLFELAEHKQAQGIHDLLCERRILVRPFPEMPDKLRFGLPADDAELERLANSLEQIMPNLTRLQDG